MRKFNALPYLLAAALPVSWLWGHDAGFTDGTKLVRTQAATRASVCHWMVNIGANELGKAEAVLLSAKYGVQAWQPKELECTSLDELASGKD